MFVLQGGLACDEKIEKKRNKCLYLLSLYSGTMKFIKLSLKVQQQETKNKQLA